MIKEYHNSASIGLCKCMLMLCLLLQVVLGVNSEFIVEVMYNNHHLY